MASQEGPCSYLFSMFVRVLANETLDIVSEIKRDFYIRYDFPLFFFSFMYCVQSDATHFPGKIKDRKKTKSSPFPCNDLLA